MFALAMAACRGGTKAATNGDAAGSQPIESAEAAALRDAGRDAAVGSVRAAEILRVLTESGTVGWNTGIVRV